MRSSFASTQVTKVRPAWGSAPKPDATRMPPAGQPNSTLRTGTGRALITPVAHHESPKVGKKHIAAPPPALLKEAVTPATAPPATRSLKPPAKPAHATIQHLKGAAVAISYATPRTARGAAALATKARLKMRARFIEESAAPRPASAHQPIRPKPFATNTPRPASAPQPLHFTRKRIQSPRIAASVASRRKFHEPIVKGQVQPAAAMPHYSTGVPPGGASHGNLLDPAPLSPLSPTRYSKMPRHVQTAARVDHEPIAFGSVGKAAVRRQQCGRRSASPPRITTPRPSMRRISSSGHDATAPSATANSTSSAATRATGAAARGATAAASGASYRPRDSCPFDVSYNRSPFIRGPPTARGPTKKAPRATVVSERPF